MYLGIIPLLDLSQKGIWQIKFVSIMFQLILAKKVVLELAPTSYRTVARQTLETTSTRTRIAIADVVEPATAKQGTRLTSNARRVAPTNF